MSTADVKYQPETKTLQTTIKLFTDDIEKVINEENGVKIFLGTDKEAKETDQYLEKYILSHFDLKTKNETVKLFYLGKEVDQDYTWVYLESNEISSPKRIEIINSLLIDYFEEQNNKVNFENGSIKNSNSFHKDKTEGFIPQ
jgi:hypothetical protein